MEFRILGPLEVRANDRVLPVPGAKQRAILAILLLNANRVVSSDRLVEELWAGEPPETATKALRVHVSHLRKALRAAASEGIVVTSGSGYLVDVKPGELDLDRFESLVRDAGEARARGDAAGAAATLREALALWRGPALGDFETERFAQPEIARLEELRLATLEELVGLDLELGKHAEVVGELEALVARNPLRERLRAHLMVALYRSGRQAEALRVYQDTRRELVEELGIEPGRELQELERAILRQDPSLDLPAPPQPRRPPVPPATPAPAGAGHVRKVVTVLFADIVDSTPLGERIDPEVLSHVKARYFDRARGVLEAHGGTVEKFIGDAVMAVFGVPRVHEDDALRAARAAVELQDAVGALNADLDRDYGVRLSVRTGVNTGEVVAGEPGSIEGFVSGDAVNVAARLQEAAQPGEILVGEETHRFVRGAVVAERVEELSVKGKAAPLAAWRLERVLPAPEDGLRSELVGRGADVDALDRAFERCIRERACRRVVVLGPAGIGKSRLVEEFGAALSDRGAVVRGRCYPYGEGIAFLPVAELVRDAVAAPADAAGLEARIAETLPDDADAARVAAVLARAVGATTEPARAEEAFWAVRRLLEVLGRRSPLVVVLEDLHWAEPTLLDLVDYLVGWTADAPVLLCCLARADLLDVRPEWRVESERSAPLVLEPLAPSESERMLASLLGGGTLAPELAARITAASDGNPLFVQELVRMLLDEGLLHREDGRWTFLGDASKLAVPPTIQALFATRLDRLPADERAVLQRAAAVGQEFWWSAVGDLSPEAERSDVGRRLQALVRRELVRPARSLLTGEDAFRFAHALVRDAAYESTPKLTRAALHERTAAWLEDRAREAPELEELVGYHLEQAYGFKRELGPVDTEDLELARRAAARLAGAGRRALAARDVAAARNLLTRSLALVPEDDPRRPALLIELQRALTESGDLRGAEEALTEAARLAEAAGDRAVGTRAAINLEYLRSLTGRRTAQEIRRTAEETIEAMREAGDDQTLAQAWQLLAYGHWLECRFGAMASDLEQALAHARRAGERRGEVDLLSRLGIALCYGPTPAAEAGERCRELLASVEEDLIARTRLEALLAELEAMQGSLDEARRLCRDARQRAEELGLTAWLAVISLHAGRIELLAGDPAVAEEALRPGYEALARMGEKSVFSTLAADLAEAVYRRGGDEAETIARASEEAAAPDDVISQVGWRRTRAKVLARGQELDAAEALAREAVERAATTDDLNLRGDALTALGEVLRLGGRVREAAGAIAEAGELYRAKGNSVGADRAAASVRELDLAAEAT